METIRKSARLKPSRIVGASALIAAVAIIGISAADLHNGYRTSLADTERHVRSLDNMLTEQVARSFEAINRTLLAAVEARLDYLNPPNNEPLPQPYEMLRAIMQGSPMLTGMGWIDASGQRTHSATGPTAPPLYVGRQEHFTVHRDSPDVGLFISHPFRSVLDNRWLIQVSRRVNNPDGSFAGTVQGALDIDYFDRTYNQMNIGEGYTVSLYLKDGTILLRTPMTYQMIGQSMADGPQFAYAFRGPESGIVRGVNVRDGSNGPRRLAAFHHVPGLPLVATVTVREDVALQRWWSSVYLRAPMALILTLIVLAGGVMLGRLLARTERQSVELAAGSAAARAAEARALDASQAKSSFLASMSHELRTPLNAVIGFSQMLQMDPRMTQQQKESAGAILKGGYHLLDLVNEVLDVASIEAGRMKFQAERLNVAEIVADARGTMGLMAERAGLTFETAVLGPVAEVHADPQRLRQVLLNLLSNAIKYNRPGGRVRFSAAPAPFGFVRFTVEDTGLGIAPERHKDLFRPFARLGAEYTNVEGTGLGLAIARQLVEAMGGTIGFESQVGRGSIFWCEMPEAAAASDDAPITDTAPASRPDGGPAHTVLYVEDNPESLRLVALMLSTRNDLVMLAAPNARAGIDLALKHHPDVIVVDINLPDMTGLELLTRFRAMQSTADVPVLAFTAAALPADVKRGLDAGFFRYLTKPLDVNAFLRAIDDALAARASDTGRQAARA